MAKAMPIDNPHFSSIINARGGYSDMEKLVVGLGGVGLVVMLIGIPVQLVMETDSLLGVGLGVFALSMLFVNRVG